MVIIILVQAFWREKEVNGLKLNSLPESPNSLHSWLWTESESHGSVHSLRWMCILQEFKNIVGLCAFSQIINKISSSFPIKNENYLELFDISYYVRIKANTFLSTKLD